jgi:hypothetical protein
MGEGRRGGRAGFSRGFEERLWWIYFEAMVFGGLPNTEL